MEAKTGEQTPVPNDGAGQPAKQLSGPQIQMAHLVRALYDDVLAGTVEGIVICTAHSNGAVRQAHIVGPDTAIKLLGVTAVSQAKLIEAAAPRPVGDSSSFGG